MPIYFLIPVFLFLGSAIANFLYLKQFRDILIERHTDTYLAYERSSLSPGWGFYRLIRWNRYKALGDVQLNRSVRNLKWSQAGFFIAIIALVAVAALLPPAR